MNASDNAASARRDARPTGVEVFASSFDSVIADCRFGLRQLRSSPVFTIVAVLTLALGMGANAAIFSILDPLLLRKLPVRNPDELVWVNSAGTLGPAEIASFLFGVHHTDPLTFIAVAAALFVAAVTACCLPARRAMRVAPVVALRNE